MDISCIVDRLNITQHPYTRINEFLNGILTRITAPIQDGGLGYDMALFFWHQPVRTGRLNTDVFAYYTGRAQICSRGGIESAEESNTKRRLDEVLGGLYVTASESQSIKDIMGYLKIGLSPEEETYMLRPQDPVLSLIGEKVQLDGLEGAVVPFGDEHPPYGIVIVVSYSGGNGVRGNLGSLVGLLYKAQSIMPHFRDRKEIPPEILEPIFQPLGVS